MLSEIKEKPRFENYGLTKDNYCLLKIYYSEYEKKVKDYNEKIENYTFRLTLVLLVVIPTFIYWRINGVENPISFPQILMVVIGSLLMSFCTAIPFLLLYGVVGIIIKQIVLKPKNIHLHMRSKVLSYEKDAVVYQNYLDGIFKRYPFIDVFKYDVNEYTDYVVNKILLCEEKQVKEDIDEYNKKKNIDYWLSLNGYEYEEEVAKLYETLGYIAKVTPKSGDGGIDVVLEKNIGELIYVQCKNHHSQIGVSVVRELYGVMSADNVKRGIIVCSNGISAGGVQFAKANSIDIITASDLIEMGGGGINKLSFTFDKGKIYTVKHRDGTTISGFLKIGCVFVYKDLFETEECAIVFIKNLCPLKDFVYQICTFKIGSEFYSNFFYIRMVQELYWKQILRKSKNLKLLSVVNEGVEFKVYSEERESQEGQRRIKKYKGTWRRF